MEYNQLLATVDSEEIAFQDIFRQHYQIVYGVARRTLGSREEAEEVAQEAFVKLYQKWPHLIITTSLTAWLAKVTINLAFNRLRSNGQDRRLSSKLETLGTHAHPSAEELTAQSEERQAVQEILLLLKPKDRACLIARHSGLTYREISDALGIKTTSVGKVLARAEDKFKKAYEKLNQEVAK